MWNPMRRTEATGGLVDIIHDVRRRWRYKLALRGAVGVLGLGVAALLLSAFGLESWRFSAGSIITFRVVLGLTLAALTYWFLLRPLLRSVSDEQVALYLEEHEPSLQSAIISAVEMSAANGASTTESPHSAALVERLVQSAVEKCQAIDRGRAVERRPVRRYAGIIAAIAVVTLAVFSLGPAYLRHALSALLIVSRSVEAAAPYRIEVTPGNATVPKGIDQTVKAKLEGFDSEQAALMVRKSPDAPFERMPLVRSETAADAHQYEGMLFDLAGPIDYFVEAAGVRSPTYKLKVVDLPYVQKLELEYHFPAYTGLEPRKVEDGGDIAVLKGTEVRVHVVPTMTSPGGQILLHDKDSTGLAPRRWRRWRSRRQVRGRPRWLLSHRARRANWREGGGVAAVHNRRAGGSAADRLDLEAGARYVGVPDRGSVRRGARRRRLRRQGSPSSCTPSTAAPRRRCACSTERTG